MNGYSLSRQYFDWAFENPTENNPTMTALYFFIVEINNRLGWKSEFSITPRECLEGINVNSYNTYKKHFDKLKEIGFIKVIKPSKNQYQANIIALSKFDNATNKALDKAIDNTSSAISNNDNASNNPLDNADEKQVTTHLTTHDLPYQNLTTQVQSTVQPNCDIHKTTNNKHTIESIGENRLGFSSPSKIEVVDFFMSREELKPSEAEEAANSFYSHHSKNKWAGVEDWRELAKTWKQTPAPAKKKGFTPPTVANVFEYFTTEKGLSLTDAQYRAEQFILFYESKAWKVGKNNMANWKSAATRSLEWEDKRLKPGYTHPAAKHQQSNIKADARF